MPKSSLSPTPLKPRITVVIERGCVRDIISTTQGVTVQVLDLDTNDDEVAHDAAQAAYLKLQADVAQGIQFVLR